MSNFEVIPDYLSPQTYNNHYYGTLEYENSFWIIKGEPIVCQMAKRLFPGCEGRGRNIAKFKNNKRNNGDLNWLMLRYPLRIEDERQWTRELEKSIEHVLKRNEINKEPIKICPDKLYFDCDLKEFQGEGVGFMMHNKRTLLADMMGLGKTVQALAFISHTESYPTLIVVPPHLRTNWMNEISRFMRIESKSDLTFFDNISQPKVHLIKGLKPYNLPEAHIYITHYLLLRGWKEILPNYGFKTVIFDEIQDLRHGKTEKYSAASLIADSCENVIGLSGTPIYNRGAEMWNIMNIIEFQCLRDYDSFTREWCNGYGSDIVKDPELLGDYLKREGLMLRRTTDEVLKELPPKRRVVQAIDSDEKLFDQLIKETRIKASQFKIINNVLEKGRLSREIVNETRKATGIAKAPYVVEFVKMLLESDEKVLLFAYHHAVFDIYRDKLSDYSPQFITGRQTQKEKDLSVENFMSGRSNICCISLRAASGLNLQKATCTVFGELDWSPAIHSQAEDRAHRMGQENSVLCYYLVSSSGSDEQIQESLGFKISQFVGLMGDKVQTEAEKIINQVAAKEHMKKIIDKLLRTEVPRN